MKSAQKMFSRKSLHPAAPAVAQGRTPAPLQPRVFGKLKLPKHFQEASLNVSVFRLVTVLNKNQKTHQSEPNGRRLARVRLVCERSSPGGKDRTISVVSVASSC